VENGTLQEIVIERASRRGLISNIYNGRVSRVLPGMQAAFIDVGLERTAFLHLSDIVRSGANGEASPASSRDTQPISVPMSAKAWSCSCRC
jgi:ribonuclease G